MTAAMGHRGPDGQGVEMYQKDNLLVGFGHRRLSIIDLSAVAGQPMSYNGLHLVFNGEIYNYQEIRDQLTELGHEFKTHSDTEVILHAWRQWGESCIEQWRGMFAIVLYDEYTNEIICIRDRAGVKPLYYYFSDGLFLFASELKAILQHPDFKKQINPEAVASYLQYGYVSWPHCIYNYTHKLSPGHILKMNLGTRVLDIKQYWNVYDYYDKPKLSITLPDAIGETERILQQSFQYRMVADVPVGVFLSGGYDSACVTALLQKNSTEKIKTFTIGAADSKLDEAPFAKEIAAHLGTDHTEYYCTAQEALDIIPDLPYHYDEPFADSSAIPTILVSRMARKSVTVALSADAGDEIFAGYYRYDYIARYGDKIKSVPKVLRTALSAVMGNISSESIPVLRNKYNFHGRYNKFRNLLEDPSPAEMMRNLTQTFTQSEINSLFATPVQEQFTAHRTNKLVEGYDALSYMMAVDYQTYMVDDILQKVDRATMAASLEGREPFLDQHIIEWAAQLPTEYKYYNRQKKYILKQIVHKYIPQQMMDRPKMGFAIPIEHWLNHELKNLVQTYLSSEKLKEHGLFNIPVVEGIINQFYGGRTEKHLQVWYLLMFQMWYEKWIGN
ncbi:asparagine synthase (glutamine-hydrolyzing) [Mucilaginibacter jinjuensis]|uniref:asparagine synthase (glutamine-hydrolyzing) n=1 Tax=Mucilaginibacter jinjuensis TaxID=1176721 RepID=A0ABY7T5W4_9SPHI|nr:asparagine synthase (glutamine-hydrolyzing) [Mucilaginibacter jinjuensis]WCT11870.1 asparagine synthase (glutamine-hydrolyzing) [Mucilaginibacter jinjuensis]